MDFFIKEKFEEYFSKNWSRDPNSFAYHDVIFKIKNDNYEYPFIQRAYKTFEAGYNCGKNLFDNG